ncbi:MAG: type II toxin-antitoxin system RelB family antitoxin [Candidatus Saccharimonadales bacterium]
MSAVCQIRIPEEMDERLRRLAAETGRSKSYYVRRALVQGLEEMEDAYIADERLAELRAGRSRTHSLAEVEKRLGLAD